MDVRPRRVLLSCAPAPGHLYPLLPLGRALRSQGHTVAVLTSASLREVVGDEGLRFLPAGPGVEALIAAAVQTRPEMASLDPVGMRAAIPIFADVRIELTLADALVASAWGPDLVISEHADFVGPLLAARIGVNHVTLGFGPGHPADWLELAAQAVAPHYTAEGLIPPPRGGLYEGMYLDTCPPSLQAPEFPVPPRRRFLRPEPYGAPSTSWSPPEFGDRSDRPLVLLTMGTLFGNPATFNAALAGLAALDVNVLVTVGPQGDPAMVVADPTWVRVERFAPLRQVLDHCDLVVAHGGAGTTLAALARGIPLVLLPQATDQFINAKRAVAAGAAISLAPAEFTSEALQHAVRRVRNETNYAVAAARIRDEVAAMPTAAQVAAELFGATTTQAAAA